MLENGVNVNFYMFFGGTNFGFTAGANNFGINKYMADVTSYDYDAIMDEAGDPYTMKFTKVRSVIAQFFDLPTIPVPERLKKLKLDDITLDANGLLLSDSGRQYLGRPHNADDNTLFTTSSDAPLTFEALNQFSGLVLYETNLPDLEIDPTFLTVNGLKDRAFVYVDQLFIGTLSRENSIYSLPINAGFGKRLQILVENQGRINFEIFNDMKGILGSVTIQKRNRLSEELKEWTMTGYPLTNYNHIKEFIDKNSNNQRVEIAKNGVLLEGPVIFSAKFDINDEIFDTYFQPLGWGKGVLYINGYNLGRYWPLVGPQITLYIPGNLLKAKDNTIVLIEYQRAHPDKKVTFTNRPRLDGIEAKVCE